MIGLARRIRRRLTAPSLETLLQRQSRRWQLGASFVLSFDVETRADCESLPSVIRILDTLGLRSSFACIGAWLEAYRAEHAALLTAGHELLNHTETHPSHEELDRPTRFDELSDEEMQAEVVRATRRLRGLGATVLGFRSPHFGAQHTARVYPLLRNGGLRYSSSTIAAYSPSGGAPYPVDGLWEFPLLTCPVHPADLLDSWHCSTAPDARHRDPRDLVRLYERVLDRLVERRVYGSVYWDPRVILEIPGYRDVLHLVASARPHLHLLTYAELLGRVEAAVKPGQ